MASSSSSRYTKNRSQIRDITLEPASSTELKGTSSSSSELEMLHHEVPMALPDKPHESASSVPKSHESCGLPRVTRLGD